MEGKERRTGKSVHQEEDEGADEGVGDYERAGSTGDESRARTEEELQEEMGRRGRKKGSLVRVVSGKGKGKPYPSSDGSSLLEGAGESQHRQERRREEGKRTMEIMEICLELSSRFRPP
jgi:hypothetical protein